jgi:glycosyltransferase involved in cell wall biosynthesis
VAAVGEAPGADPAQLPFDSIVCFGGVDWWYHNRGHFDVQLMRHLGKRVPALYVNSIAMRFPSPREGSMFVRRIARKLASVRKQLQRIEPGFSVLSPLSVPGSAARGFSGPAVALQVRLAARRLGFRRPLLWVTTPTAIDSLPSLRGHGLVYLRTDRYEAFPGVDEARIRSADLELKRRADLTIYCASALLEQEKGECRNPIFVDHGVDFEAFERGGTTAVDPEDLRGVRRPRVGFVGAIDRHTFDPELFAAVVERLPDLEFVLVGGSTIHDAPWLAAPNVHRLGQKPYTDVWRYPGACDVLIMPWNRSPWIEVCNPVKLKEYLAAGRPIVTTPFRELHRYEGCVTVARTADEFATAIRAAVTPEARARAEALRGRVREETWTHQAERTIARIREAVSGPGR